MSRRARDEMAQFLEVLAFSAFKHRAQRRKDRHASAYINHPIELARVLHNEGGVSDPATLCAAILHDTVEDTQTTRAELARRFGSAIARIVMEVTDRTVSAAPSPRRTVPRFTSRGRSSRRTAMP